MKILLLQANVVEYIGILNMDNTQMGTPYNTVRSGYITDTLARRTDLGRYGPQQTTITIMH